MTGNVRKLLVGVALAAAVLLILSAFSVTAVKIIVIIIAWMALLGVVALGFEVLVQTIGRAIKSR